MFTFQPTKRRRDDDSDSDDERYVKKSRSWSAQLPPHDTRYPWPSGRPLRPLLPPSPPRALPELETTTLTQPSPSETDSPASVLDDFSARHGGDVDGDVNMDANMDVDEDMDETDFDYAGSPPSDSFSVPTFRPPMRPAKLDSSLFGRHQAGSNAGRIPTPMYPNFPGSRGPPLRTSSVGGVGSANSDLSMDTTSASRMLQIPASSIPQTPPSVRKHAETDRNRRGTRMPSPISEDEGPDADFVSRLTFSRSSLARLSVTASIAEQIESAEPPMTPPGLTTTPTTSSAGRKRSGALLGRYCRFAMGYREDCEKCRMRVPGHYSHFLPS